MKHVYTCLSICFFVFTAAYGYEGTPFKLATGYDYVSHAEIDEDDFHHEHINFGYGFVDLDFIFCYNPCCEEGAALQAGYSNIYLGWKQNPDFNQTHFNILTLGLLGFSNRLDDWFWTAYVNCNIDLDHFDFDHYSTWDLLLWGRRDLCTCHELGFNLGFYAQTGMKIDKVYPIIGFDWWQTEKLKVNLVFPIDMSVLYYYTPCFSFGPAVRFFECRDRTGEKEPVPMSVFYYRTYGGEIAVNYECGETFYFNVHAGYSFGGTLRIADKHNGNSRNLDLDAAPYVGGELSYRF